MDDFVWIILWLVAGVGVFVALVGVFKLLAWWLSKRPKIARVFTIVLSGFCGASISGVAATVFTFLRYSFRGGMQIYGMDRGAFIIAAASTVGFVIGALLAYFFSQRLLRTKKDDHAASCTAANPSVAPRSPAP